MNISARRFSFALENALTVNYFVAESAILRFGNNIPNSKYGITLKIK